MTLCVEHYNVKHGVVILPCFSGLPMHAWMQCAQFSTVGVHTCQVFPNSVKRAHLFVYAHDVHVM